SNCIFSLSIHPLHSYIFPLSLHDALPILLALSDRVEAAFRGAALTAGVEVDVVWDAEPIYLPHRVNEPLAQRYAATLAGRREVRSEEHTSELQSRFDLVCRRLLEKKNNL